MHVKFGMVVHQNYTYKFSRNYCLCASNTDHVIILCDNVYSMQIFTIQFLQQDYVSAILHFYQTAQIKYLETFTCLQK
jgi:hypothetical protein